jgi:hypothetical protein
MTLTALLTRGRGALRRPIDPFTGPRSTTPAAPRTKLRANPLESMQPALASRRRQSWFGWLFGNSRRTPNGHLVQGELLLQKVKPVRNDFRDDDRAATARAKPRVLWETPRQEAPRDDQDHAWNRLRNRRPDSLVVKPD